MNNHAADGDYARVFKGDDEQWYATLYAGNHEPFFTSEGHANRDDVAELVQSRGFPIQEPPE